MKQKVTKKYWWYGLALVTIMLAVPHSTLIKLVTEQVNPLWLNVIRFLIGALVMTPIVLKSRQQFNRLNLRYVLIAGIAYAIAVAAYASAIYLGQASLVGIFNLSIPIIFVVYSVYLTHEAIGKHTYVGIGLAALGGLIIVMLSLLESEGGLTQPFGLITIILALINCLMFPLVIIMSKKANQNGLSVWTTFGLIAWIVFIFNLGVALVLALPAPVISIVLEPSVLAIILYSSLGITILSRIVNTVVYKKIGSAPVSGLQYMEYSLVIIAPMIILGERLPVAMFLGVALILLGVILIEFNFKRRRHLKNIIKVHTSSQDVS